MQKERCELCGYSIEPGHVERHHVVPTNVTEQAGLPESQTLRLCGNCHREVNTWYLAKVSDTVYDPKTKRFRTRSWLEMAKEYESVFNGYMNYKKKRTKPAEQLLDCE